MDFSDIERILALVREHDLAEFELESDGLKLRVRKSGGSAPQAVPDVAAAPVAQPPPASPAAAVAPVQATYAAPVPDDAELELAVVKSPIVGTFYRSPEPGAPSFVEVGQRVKKDQVLCIIEAMKLMNEIESDADGTVMKIFPQNGQPIEYGERLFALKA